jgi:hypothetical protein
MFVGLAVVFMDRVVLLLLLDESVDGMDVLPTPNILFGFVLADEPVVVVVDSDKGRVRWDRAEAAEGWLAAKAAAAMFAYAADRKSFIFKDVTLLF